MRRRGSSRGLATHRFGSKPELFAEVIRGISRRWREEVTAAVAGRVGINALLAFVDTHRRLAEREPNIMRAVYVLWFQSLIAQSPMRVAAIEDLLGHRDWVQERLRDTHSTRQPQTEQTQALRRRDGELGPVTDRR